MKTTLFTLCIVLCLFTSNVCGQISKPYPIPSYNVLVQTNAAFQETSIPTNKGKRNINVHPKPLQSTDSSSCFCIVLIYSLDKQDVLGPYTVNCSETLTVPIDEREWGVLVTSDTPVEVSVWIDEGSLLKKTGTIPSKQIND